MLLASIFHSGRKLSINVPPEDKTHRSARLPTQLSQLHDALLCHTQEGRYAKSNRIASRLDSCVSLPYSPAKVMPLKDDPVATPGRAFIPVNHATLLVRLETLNNEIERMAALHETGLMDDTCETEFTQLVTLAAEICGMPIGAFSVVSEQIVQVKAAFGAPVVAMPRDGTFCAHVVQQRQTLVVEDALLDPMFCSLLPVTDGGLRFYAGVPLSAPNGQVLGTLCVADTKPRSLTASQRTALDVLGVQLCTRIELRLQQRRVQEALTVQDRLLLEVRSSELRFRAFMDNAPILGFIKDTEGRFVFCNRELAKQFNVETNDWLGKSISEIWPGELADTYRENDLDAMRNGSVLTCEEETIDDAGVSTYWRSFKFPFRNGQGELFLGGMSVNITEERFRRQALERSNKELELLNRQDSLTGLASRRFIEHRLRHTYDTAGRDGTPFSLILLDVDNFKAINDGFGHSTGDLVLKGLGEIVRSCVRETDIAARFGGEEVLILLPHTGPEAALLCAHRMRRALEQAQWPHGRVTASFGVATHVSGSGSLQNLLRDVDQAMYQAKRTGKNKVVRQGTHDADPDHPSHRRCGNMEQAIVMS